ncbi:MAG: hypothetical protein M0Z60_09805 [Nitrospiraceae bacterium]|nr:hypothetical protein [Nitrospiraceae bacterium]
MTYSQAIRSGFRLINSRWQLVAVQAGLMLFNCIAFFLMVIIPLGIAFVIFGLDLTGLAQLKNVLGLIRNPAELLSKYFGLVMVVLTSLLFYVLLVTTLGLYVFGGSVGVVGRSILEPDLKFSLRSFFAEAKKLFFPIMWYSLVAGIVFILVAFLLGLFAGGIAAVVSAAKGQDSTLALFLGIFFSLVLILIGISLVFGAIAVTVYGIAALFFKGEGAMRSFRGGFRFVWDHQNAFWLYAVLLTVYIIVSFLVMLIVYPFNLIPIIGTIISIPFQIISYVIRGYFGLVIIAIVFCYYYEIEIRKDAPAGNRPVPAETTAGSSSLPEDISSPEAAGQETSLPEKGGPEGD